MSSTMESKSNKPTRASTFDVSPSVRNFIADSDGNLDEKAAVAALSQTREQNKHMWIGCFVLIGVVLILIAANIGTSVAVARLTRPLNIDPVTGMATIAGNDEVVMKTSTALFKEEDLNFHSVSIDYLSALTTVEFNEGDISFDVKGFARMSDETVLLVEGGALMFDIIGLKNVTGDEPTQMMSSVVDDKKSIDLDGRKLSGNCPHPKGTDSRCGPNQGDTSCPEHKQYCHEAFGWCGNQYAQFSTEYNYCDIDQASLKKVRTRSTSSVPHNPCYPVYSGDSSRCGLIGFNAQMEGPMSSISSQYVKSSKDREYSCPSTHPYCNEGTGWCIELERGNQESIKYHYAPHCM